MKKINALSKMTSLFLFHTLKQKFCSVVLNPRKLFILLCCKRLVCFFDKMFDSATQTFEGQSDDNFGILAIEV